MTATIVALSAGCATVGTRVPPEDYCSIGNKTVRVQTGEDEPIEAIHATCRDSTLLLGRARYPDWDKHDYPLRVPLKDVRSMETLRVESLVYIESGVEAGTNYGLESDLFSETAFVTEIGYLSGERASRPRPRIGLGATLYLLASTNDLRAGLKARARYRFNNTLSCDIAAGPMLDQGDFNGYVASASLNLGSYVTVKSEYLVFGIDDWEYVGGPEEYVLETGDERVWYNGIAFRNGAGWVAGAGGGIALIIIVASAFGALGGST